MNPRPPIAAPRRFSLNPQLREELSAFIRDQPARWRALKLALLAGLALLLTWPRDLALDLDGRGFTYPALGLVILVAVAYLGLIHGIRYRPGGGAHGLREWAAFVPLAPNRYLRGTLAGRLSDPLFFLVLTLPLLVPAAALEGAGAGRIAAGMAVVVGTAITARWVAFCLQIHLEHRPGLLIAAAHASLVGLFVVGVFWEPLSPLAAFRAAAGPVPANPLAWPSSPWPGFLLTHGAIWALCYGLAYLRIRRLRISGAAAQPAR